jgi:hypothetical protein
MVCLVLFGFSFLVGLELVKYWLQFFYLWSVHVVIHVFQYEIEECDTGVFFGFGFHAFEFKEYFV